MQELGGAVRLLEFEAKTVLKRYGIAIPAGVVISEGEMPSNEIDSPAMLKAQIPIGGRGKAGGVLDAETGSGLTRQIEALFTTRVRGFQAKKLLIEERADVSAEFYMAITYDTVAKAPIAIFSSEGGVDIEELAQKEPEKIFKEQFSFRDGLPEYRARQIVAETGVSGKVLLGAGAVLAKLARAFIETDATIAEINPLALTESGKLIALDCHLDIDDDALFRQPEMDAIDKDGSRLESARSQSDFEREAAQIDNLDHRGVAGRVIEFDGSLGLIIGGGGASLTAFDAVRAHGGKPANYCEIGGNPSVRKVKELTRHILSKPGVEKVAVIMNVVSNTRVDLVARGIVKGILEAGKVPSETVAVFRIPGAWEDEGFKILSKYGVLYCDRNVSIDEAAGMAVASVAE
jgi:succinyl-CoA synthetase beta subunit/citryl-CoA synthetase large subunit